MFLTVADITIAVLLIVSILLQMQGSGLSSSFGGSGGEFYRSRRSMEKSLVWVTVILTVLFAVVSIILLLPR